MKPPDYSELRTHYACMRTEELVGLALTGHLTPQARYAMEAELWERRHEIVANKYVVYRPRPKRESASGWVIYWMVWILLSNLAKSYDTWIRSLT